MTMFVGHPNISNQSWHAYEYKHMNTQETILQLEDLKLKGMAECYKGLPGFAGKRMANIGSVRCPAG